MNIETLFNALPGAVAQGLIWGIMAIGLYITYKVLDYADLTADIKNRRTIRIVVPGAGDVRSYLTDPEIVGNKISGVLDDLTAGNHRAFDGVKPGKPRRL